MAAVTLPDLVNFMAILVVSTACHESAHARLADRFGDGTPREAGRISWNPFVHLHPIYSLLLPAVVFWQTGGYIAGAFTPVNPSRMRNPRLHSMLVALAGPATNVLLAIVFFVALAGFLVAVGGVGRASPEGQLNVVHVLELAIEMNLFLALLNFLPIPPLDGSDIVAYLLPVRLRGYWIDFRRHAWIVLLVLMFTGVLGAILHPAMRFAGRWVAAAVHVVNEFARG